MSRFKFEMKLGAEPKKAALLIGLVALIPLAYYLSDSTTETPRSSTPTQPAAPARPVAKAPKAPLATRAQQSAVTSPRALAQPGKGAAREFRPSLKPKKEEEQRDLAQVDPTLRLDLLAKLQQVKSERPERSLFDFSSSPERRPRQPEPKIDLKKKPATVAVAPAAPTGPPPAPVKPPPPPIPLKFYGNSLPMRGSARRVFCMNGDEVQAPAEGDVLQRRYKIIQINASSVVVEDLEYKNRQTLTIEEVPNRG